MVLSGPAEYSKKSCEGEDEQVQVCEKKWRRGMRVRVGEIKAEKRRGKRRSQTLGLGRRQGLFMPGSESSRESGQDAKCNGYWYIADVPWSRQPSILLSTLLFRPGPRPRPL